MVGKSSRSSPRLSHSTAPFPSSCPLCAGRIAQDFFSLVWLVPSVLNDDVGLSVCIVSLVALQSIPIQLWAQEILLLRAFLLRSPNKFLSFCATLLSWSMVPDFVSSLLMLNYSFFVCFCVLYWQFLWIHASRFPNRQLDRVDGAERSSLQCVMLLSNLSCLSGSKILRNVRLVNCDYSSFRSLLFPRSFGALTILFLPFSLCWTPWPLYDPDYVNPVGVVPPLTILPP